MSGQVLCLVRGGEAGRSTQEQAILFSRQSGMLLVFLHVISPASYQTDNQALLDSVLVELTWLARVNLSLARQRAERGGTKAEMEIRTGPFVDTVQAYLREEPVERVFMGKPREDQADYELRLANVESIVKRLSEVSKAEIILV